MYLVTLSSLQLLKNRKKLCIHVHAFSWVKLWMKLVWFDIIILKMTLFSLLFAGAIVRYYKTKRILHLQSLPETNKKQNRQNRTTKYVQEGKGYVDLNFFNFVSHCMCKKHQPIIDLYGAKLQLTAVLTLKWPSRSSPISPCYISFRQKNI